MTRRTKIVATLGPSTEDKSEIHALVESGMNIVRINFSHAAYEQTKKIAKNVRTVEKEEGKIITIMQDLQGPKIRLGEMPDGSVPVEKGETLTFCTKTSACNPAKGIFHIPYPPLPKVVKKGEALLIEDGLIRTKILSAKGDCVKVKVLTNGTLKSRKGVNIPDSKLPNSAALTAKDRKDLAFGIKTLKVDAVAVSFVENANDIVRVRREIAKHTSHPIPIIAKIERQEALRNLESIIEAADGVMVARGDLGIETKPERVPLEQKKSSPLHAGKTSP